MAVNLQVTAILGKPAPPKI